MKILGYFWKENLWNIKILLEFIKLRGFVHQFCRDLVLNNRLWKGKKKMGSPAPPCGQRPNFRYYNLQTIPMGSWTKVCSFRNYDALIVWFAKNGKTAWNVCFQNVFASKIKIDVSKNLQNNAKCWKYDFKKTQTNLYRNFLLGILLKCLLNISVPKTSNFLAIFWCVYKTVYKICPTSAAR